MWPKMLSETKTKMLASRKFEIYPSISTADLSDVDRTKGNVAVPCHGLAQATPSKSP